MNIFVDATTLTGQYSGTGVYTRYLIRGLGHPETGLRVHAIGGDKEHHCEPDFGRQVEWIKTENGPHTVLNSKLLGNFKGYTADTSIFPNYFMPPGWPVPSAVTIHDISFITHPQFYSRRMRNWYRIRIRHTLKHANIILTVSETSRGNIISKLGADPERVIVHKPVAAEVLQPGKSPYSKPYLVYIGNMEPKKNLLNLIKAYNKAGLGDTDLMLIGKIHASAAWAKRFRTLVGQSPGVHYLGYLPENEMNNWLVNSCGLINISYVEGFGITQLKALVNGIPVLISKDPALVEISRGYSLTTDPDDIRQIADQLNRLLTVSVEETHVAAGFFRKAYSADAYQQDIGRLTGSLKESVVSGYPVPVENGRVDLMDAIISGICYAGVFNSSIHSDKLLQSLPVRVVCKKEFRAGLNTLKSEYPDVFKINGNVIALKNLRNRVDVRAGQLVRKRHQRLIRLLGGIPWVRALYFSGGTVHGSGLDKHPDLDVFIVTATGRSWLVYCLVRVLSILSGKGSSLCANYLVDESAQEIFWQRDHYSAFQLLFLRQVFRKKGTPHIRSFNRWIADFFPNALQSELIGAADKPNKRGLIDWINMVVMFLWIRRWRKSGKRSGHGGMYWDFSRIKLHSNDHRPLIYRKFEELQGKCREKMKDGVVKPMNAQS